jgi:hypothetical protein
MPPSSSLTRLSDTGTTIRSPAGPSRREHDWSAKKVSAPDIRLTGRPGTR